MRKTKKKQKRLTKKQKEKRNKKIAAGVGITAGIGLLGWLGYKYAYPLAKEQFYKAKAKKTQAEKLSSIEELAAQGITEEEENMYAGHAKITVEKRDSLLADATKFRKNEAGYHNSYADMIAREKEQAAEAWQNTLDTIASSTRSYIDNTKNPEWLCRTFNKCDGKDFNGNVLERK